jgi:hypothetical protein
MKAEQVQMKAKQARLHSGDKHKQAQRWRKQQQWRQQSDNNIGGGGSDNNSSGDNNRGGISSNIGKGGSGRGGSSNGGSSSSENGGSGSISRYSCSTCSISKGSSRSRGTTCPPLSPFSSSFYLFLFLFLVAFTCIYII